MLPPVGWNNYEFGRWPILTFYIFNLQSAHATVNRANMLKDAKVMSPFKKSVTFS